MAEFVTAYVGPNNIGSGLPGTGNWSNVGDIYSKNGIGSSTTGLAVGADSLTVTASFTAGLTAQNIPGDAIIRGIEVIVWAKGPGFGDAPTTTKARFITPITTEKSVAGNWSDGSFSARSFGSPTDLWGGVWTRDTVLNSKFGVQVTNGSSTGYTYAIDYIEMRVHWDAAPPPTLKLDLSKYIVPVNAPVGYVAANVLGKHPDSMLTALPSMDPRLTLVGTELKIAAHLVDSNDWLQVAVAETLDRATNSPYELLTVIDAGPVRICEFIGSATGTNTLSIPTHQPGDLIVSWLFRDGSTTVPVTPAGFTSENSGTGTSASYRLVWRIATVSNTSPGAATTATSTITHVYRPNPGYTLSVGASSTSSGTGASVNYQVLTLENLDGTSWVGSFSGHRSVNTTLETPPLGMVLRSNVVDATDEASGFDTDGGVDVWTTKSVPVGGTASGWTSVSYEIKGDLASGRKSPRFSYWT